jgi:heterogeneous nuclear ribonucleoprotein R
LKKERGAIMVICTTNNSSDQDEKQKLDCGDGVKTENFQLLIEAGLDASVAAKLDDIFKTGKLKFSELDDRAVEALKEFSINGALEILDRFLKSELTHVSNKSAFLCGIMKNYRQKVKALREGASAERLNAMPVHNGPPPEVISRILDRTGYELDVTSGKLLVVKAHSD